MHHLYIGIVHIFQIHKYATCESIWDYMLHFLLKILYFDSDADFYGDCEVEIFLWTNESFLSIIVRLVCLQENF